MTAATFWSLLVPALEMAEEMNNHNRALALFPVIVGFLLGAGFVHLTDTFLPDNVNEIERAVILNRIF
jgi:zinc transporter ZupT